MSNKTMNYEFDASQYEPDVGVEAIPAGTYDVIVESTELFDLKDNKGQGFKVVFCVANGEYKGSKVYNQYNLWHNQSPQACEIAHKQLSALCYVTGQFKLDFNNAGASLKGASLKINVTNDGKYNSVKAVYDVNGNKPNRAGTGTAPAQTAPVAQAQPTPVAVAQPQQPSAGNFGAPAQQPQGANPQQFPPFAQQQAGQPPATAQPQQQYQAAPAPAQQPQAFNNAQPTQAATAPAGAPPWTPQGQQAPAAAPAPAWPPQGQ